MGTKAERALRTANEKDGARKQRGTEEFEEGRVLSMVAGTGACGL